MDEGIELLIRMFQGRDWFHSVGHDQYGRYVVYTNFMCEESLHDIPDVVFGKQVLCHFAASKLATADQFKVAPPGRSTPAPSPVLELLPQEEEEDIEELDSSFLEADLSELCRELDRLERQCGSNCLQDLFYEVHDGKNAVTNLGAKYPDVKAALQRLYDEYGFDVIYEELDG